MLKRRFLDQMPTHNPHQHISVDFPYCGTCVYMHECPQRSYLYISQLVLVGFRVISSVKGKAAQLCRKGKAAQLHRKGTLIPHPV